MGNLVSLRFIKRMEPYSVEDVAGFDLDYAHRLVASGAAVFNAPPPGLDQYGNPIKKEAAVKEPKPKTAPKKEPKSGMKSRRSGKLGTVKK